MMLLILSLFTPIISLLDNEAEFMNPPSSHILDPFADHTADSFSEEQTIEQSIEYNKWIDRDQINQIRASVLESISQLVNEPTDEWQTPTEQLARLNERSDYLPERRYTKDEMTKRRKQLVEQEMKKMHK